MGPASCCGLSADAEQVGGVEETDGADDQRVRWNWWFDATKLQAKALP